MSLKGSSEQRKITQTYTIVYFEPESMQQGPFY